MTRSTRPRRLHLQLPPVTAVLLAGGGGSRLYPLNAAGTPKVLLPVANRPLLTFPLRMLEESGIADVVVVRGADAMPCCRRRGCPAPFSRRPWPVVQSRTHPSRPQVCEGEAAQAVRAWLATGYSGGLNIEVRAARSSTARREQPQCGSSGTSKHRDGVQLGEQQGGWRAPPPARSPAAGA